MFWFFSWSDMILTFDLKTSFIVTAHPLTKGTLKFETLEPIGLIFLINCKVVIICCVITQFYLDAGKTELWEYRNFRTIKHCQAFQISCFQFDENLILWSYQQQNYRKFVLSKSIMLNQSECLIEHPQPMYAEHILVFIAAKNELRLEYLCYFLKCFLYDL